MPHCPRSVRIGKNILHRNIFRDNKGSTKALGCECWTNQELREDFASKDVFFTAEEQIPQPRSMDEGACFDCEDGLVDAGTTL